jgi:hypothetical protein
MAERTFLSKAETANIRAAFERLDADGNGTLDADELLAMMRILGFGEGMTGEGVAAIMAEADTDHSGALDFGEFLHALQHGSLGQASVADLRAGQLERKISAAVDGGAFRRYRAQPAVRQAASDANPGASFGEMRAALAAQWTAFSEAAKRPFAEEAAAELGVELPPLPEVAVVEVAAAAAAVTAGAGAGAAPVPAQETCAAADAQQQGAGNEGGGGGGGEVGSPSPSPPSGGGAAAAPPPTPTLIYHGHKHFWRVDAELELHLFACDRQYTLVAFHKQRHEEFAQLALDRAALDACVGEQRSALAARTKLSAVASPDRGGSQRALDVFGGGGGGSSSGKSGSKEKDISSPEIAVAAAAATAEAHFGAVAKYVVARLCLAAATTEPAANKQLLAVPTEPALDSEASSLSATRRPSGADADTDDGTCSRAETADTSGCPGGVRPIDVADALSTSGGSEQRRFSFKAGMVKEIDDDDSGGGGSSSPPQQQPRGLGRRQPRRGVALQRSTGDTWGSLEVAASAATCHVFEIERIHVADTAALARKFDDGAAALRTDADELARQRQRAHKFSAMARFALTAFDDLLSRIRKESPEVKAVRSIIRQWRLRKARRQAEQQAEE